MSCLHSTVRAAGEAVAAWRARQSSAYLHSVSQCGKECSQTRTPSTREGLHLRGPGKPDWPRLRRLGIRLGAAGLASLLGSAIRRL